MKYLETIVSSTVEPLLSGHPQLRTPFSTGKLLMPFSQLYSKSGCGYKCGIDVLTYK